MGLLDLYNSGQTDLNIQTTDLITNYPSTATGTPTNTQNPGGPVTNFVQPYNSTNTYVSTVQNRLEQTLDITNLDTTDPGVTGGPNADIVTQYPATVTGTPTNTQNPGGPVVNFNPRYNPFSTYLSSVGTGRLQNTLDITNLDVENPNVIGGPNTDITTQYPATVTGTPTNTQNPGGPVVNFSQPNTPTNTYLSNVGTGKLEDTLDITNLDVENPGVIGGPNADIVTQYPATVTGTPTNTQNPGGPVTNFSQPNTPTNTYLSNVGNGKLENTLDITNLDVEDPGVIGGPNADIITNYSPLVTGTPTVIQNTGDTPPFASGAAPKRFIQSYLPNATYLNNNPIAGTNSGQLSNTLNITNLDVEDPGVDGGIPYNQLKDPTVYPVTTNHSSAISGWFAQPSTAAKKFFQKYNPVDTYLSFI